MTPVTVTLSGIFCGEAKSLLGSFSATTGSAPTQTVRISLIPLAVRSRTACSPSLQSGAILTVALIWLSLTISSLPTLKPGL